MKVLVTGAAGLVGRHLLAVLHRDHELYGLVRSGDVSGRMIRQDLRLNLDRTQLPKELDVIIHCAGIVGETNKSDEQYEEVNVNGTRRLLEYGKDSGTSVFVFLSTGGVYAPTSEPLTESATIQPHGKYAISKWNAERLCQQYACANLKIIVLRPFFPYGVGQVDRLLPSLRDRIVKNKPISLNSDGAGPYINPVYVNDLVSAIRDVMIATGQNYAVYNVGGVETVSLRVLSEKIGIQIDRTPLFNINYHSESINWIGVTNKLEQACSWRSATSLDVGLTYLFGVGQ